MDIYLSILVIILAIIGFLILYYYSSKGDEKRKGRRLPLNRMDFETGEEIKPDIVVEKTRPEAKISSEDRSEIEQKTRPEFLSGVQSEDRREPLREKYGQTFIRLFVKDPRYLYSYWEVSGDQHSFYNNPPFLRLHNEDDNSYYDISINHHTPDWYLRVKPDQAYRIQLGYRQHGEFYPLVSSSIVRTPPAKPSDRVDEHWMTIEGLSRYTIRVEMDTMEMIKNIERRKIEDELKADSYSLVKK